MADKRTMTADERRDIKEITAICKVLDQDGRKVILNIGHDLEMM